MSQDLNPSICSYLVIFMYWACENHSFKTTSTEKLRQHSLIFALNRTYCRFFLWRLYANLAPPSHPGQSTTLLQLERLRSKCAKLHTVHQATIKIPSRANLISTCSHHMGVVLHAHPVRGDSHIHHNANW